MSRRQTSVLALLTSLAVLGCGHRLDTVPDVAMVPLPVAILDYTDLAAQGNEQLTVRVRRGAGQLLYIGTHHTQDPDNPQIDGIVNAWSTFRPTIALAEGRLGRYLGGMGGAIKTFGEAGAVFVLANRHGVPVYSLEASLAHEMRFMLERWRADRVAMFYVLRGTMSRPRDAREHEAQDLISKRTAWPGLEGSLRDLAHLDSLYRAELPQLDDWRTAEGTILWPGRTESYLNEIATSANQFRDEYMVNLLRHLLDRGERIFAVVGNSHVVMQAPALQALEH